MDYFESLIYDVFKKNPFIVEGLKTEEDENKIYTPLGYIDKKKLED